MRKNRTFILFQSILVFLFAVVDDTKAQSAAADLNIEQFAQEEKKAFKHLSQLNNGRAETYLATTASNNFDVNFYRCEWEIDPNIRFIRGKVTPYFTITSPADKIVFDLSNILTVDSIIYRGNKLVFQQIANDGLQLQFPSILSAGQNDSLSIFYNGIPRDNIGFRPFVQSAHNGVPVIWTLSEPYGAKEWWPCKNGLDDKADSIDVLIKNPIAYQASSNGSMVSESVNNGIKLSTWKHRYPIASYLVAMAVTNFAVLKDTVLIGGKAMDLIDYIYPENTDNFNSQRVYTKLALGLYGNLFGDYPFAKEKYGFTQFGWGGGMEHQTNSFMTNASTPLIEHETAHQWFGDKITCGSWTDIWLNEGFATYCQVLFNEYIDTVNYFPILRNMTRDITTIPNGSVWVSDTTDPNRIFNTKLTYYKGAFLLHMLRWKLGDDVFFRAIRKYLNDPTLQYNYARTADLKRNLEQESGQNLTVFFQKWFYGEGYPSYNCTWRQNKNNWANVQINQTTSHASVSFYDMPVQLRFKNAARDTLITVNNQQNGQIFWVNPGFAADSMFVDPFYHILAKGRIVQKIPAKSTVENDIKIYPNPAPVSLNVLILNPTGQQISMQLYNVSGQLVYRTEKLLNGQDEMLTIPVSQLARGAYILSIADTKNLRIKKMIMR
jgi:aminopeptidase N